MKDIERVVVRKLTVVRGFLTYARAVLRYEVTDASFGFDGTGCASTRRRRGGQ